MPGIVSLEHSNFMSDNTQDEFEPEASVDTEEAAPMLDSTHSQLPTTEETEQKPDPANAENALPLIAQGETNGGPLGCCLGTMVGLLLSLSLAILSRLFAEPLGSLLQNNYWLLGLIVRILMGIMAFALAVLFGYIGWKLGRRFYREYDPPLIKTRARRSRPKKLQSRA